MASRVLGLGPLEQRMISVDLTALDGEELKSLSRQAKQLTRRAALTRELPKLGSGVEEGSTNTENLDHLARCTANLSDSERAALAALDGEVASAAMT